MGQKSSSSHVETSCPPCTPIWRFWNLTGAELKIEFLDYEAHKVTVILQAGQKLDIVEKAPDKFFPFYPEMRFGDQARIVESYQNPGTYHITNDGIKFFSNEITS